MVMKKKVPSPLLMILSSICTGVSAIRSPLTTNYEVPTSKLFPSRDTGVESWARRLEGWAATKLR